LLQRPALRGILFIGELQEMKRTARIKILALIIPILFLQVNRNVTIECRADDTSVEAKSAAEETSPEAKSADDQKSDETKKVEEEVLLADTHKKAGIECAGCHKETPPATEAPKAVCLTCHEGYKDVAASYIDPHNAHTEFTNCSDCHHSHKKSENQCLQCHDFNIKTP
jgi:hypothetical protein